MAIGLSCADAASGVQNVAFVISASGEVLGYQTKNQMPTQEEEHYVVGDRRRFPAALIVPAFDVLGEDVLVSGAGPIGLMATAVARHAGARHVAVSEPNAFRRALASPSVTGPGPGLGVTPSG